MRILINAFSARRGGGQTYLVNLLENLGDFQDVEVLVLASNSLKIPKDGRIKRILTAWPTENPLLRSVWERLFLKRLLSETKADILFSPGGLINTSVPKGCKAVVTFQNIMPFDHAQRAKYPYGLMRLRNLILEKALLNSMARADLVIFISDFAKGVIQGRLGAPVKKSITIPHGLGEMFKGNHTGPRPKYLPSGDYFLYVSILDVYKNQVEVVRGYSLLKQRRVTNEKLLLVGHDKNPYADVVKSEVSRLGLQKDVVLTGGIDYRELPMLYSMAKVNIFASECENCPNILLEALGSGRPLLSSNRQPMPEFAGDAVKYFDPTSSEDFANKLEELVENDHEMKALSSKALERARLYDWEKTARLTWKSIRELRG